jgi:multidrug resistance protein, MATE family
MQIEKTLNMRQAIKETVWFSVPLVGFRIMAAINNFLAMILIARLGQKELAASSLIASSQLTLNVTGWSIIFAVSIIVGFAIGQKKFEDLSKILHQSWLLSLLLSIPMTLICWEIGPILRFFGQQEDLVQMIQPYFHILAFGVLPSLLYMSVLQFITGLAKARIVLLFVLLNTFVIVFFGYALLFGKMGFPRLGLIGMAYINTFSWYFALAQSLFYLWINPEFKSMRLFQFVRSNLFYFKKTLKLGVPMSIQLAAELSAFSFSIIMVGWINQTSLAASQIVIQLNMIALMLPFGIMQASSVLVGRAFGEGNHTATRVYGEAGMLSGLAVTIVIAAVYLLFPEALMRFYHVNVADPANFTLVHITTILFAIAAFSQIFDGLRNIATGALRGYHDSVAPMWIGILSGWVFSIPVSYLLGIKLHYGAPGISGGFLFGFALGTVLLIRRFYKRTC